MRVAHKRKKSAVLTHFRTIFGFSKVTKCCKLQHFCVLPSFAGAMRKRRKCCKYYYLLQNTANTSVFESKAKNVVNYSIFGVLIAKNAGIYSVFAISRKRGRHETL